MVLNNIALLSLVLYTKENKLHFSPPNQLMIFILTASLILAIKATDFS